MKFYTRELKKPDNDFWLAYDKLLDEVLTIKVHFNSFWLQNYIKYFQKSYPVVIFATYNSNDILVACLPMQINKKRATRYYNYTVLMPLGSGPSDFFDILVNPNYENSIYNLKEFILKQHFWDKFLINNIAENSLGLQLFKKSLTDINFSFKASSGFYYVDTNGMTWQKYYDSFFKKNNKDLAKSERRLISDQIKLKIKTYNKDTFKILNKNLDLYKTRRESLGQFNKYESSDRKDFLKEVITEFEKKEQVEITELVNIETNEVYAFQLDWIYENVRYHWNHAYNENYKRYSPGKIILKELMIKSFNSKTYIECNHMRGLSKYKSKLANRRENLMMLEFDNPKSFKVKLTKCISKILKIIK